MKETFRTKKTFCPQFYFFVVTSLTNTHLRIFIYGSVLLAIGLDFWHYENVRLCSAEQTETSLECGIEKVKK